MTVLNENSARYTLTLQDVVEVNEINIFNFDYTISGVSKEVIEERFKNKFYFREIGYETISMFMFKFKQEWLNKLSVYNKLFENIINNEINPLLKSKRSVYENLNKLLNIDVNANITSSSNGTSSGTTKMKDTPITEFDDSNFISGKEDFDRSDDNSATSSNTRDSVEDEKNERDYTEEVYENIYETTKNIYEKMIDIVDKFILEFSPLFMGIY